MFILDRIITEYRRRQWHPTPVLLPGKSHGWRSLVGCSPWGGYQSDTTERLHFHFSLSCIGEGNGNPLQCSCLENPRDGGAWWAAIYGFAQSRTRLKRLSSSSSSMNQYWGYYQHLLFLSQYTSEWWFYLFEINVNILSKAAIHIKRIPCPHKDDISIRCLYGILSEQH